MRYRAPTIIAVIGLSGLVISHQGISQQTPAAQPPPTINAGKFDDQIFYQSRGLHEQVRMADSSDQLVHQNRAELILVTIQTGVLFGAIVLSFFAFRAAKRAAIAAEETNRMTAQIFKAERRPLIKPTIKLEEVVWESNFRARLNLNVETGNIGQSPALSVRFFSTVAFFDVGFSPPREMQRQTYEAAPTRSIPVGQTVYPGDSETFRLSVEMLAPEANSTVLVPYLLGCVYYETNFGLETHHAGFLNEILIRLSGQSEESFLQPDMNLMSAKLRLRVSPYPSFID